MKKFLIAGSSLVAVAGAGTAGAVDVTLGGEIDMSVEYGVKNSAAGGIAFGDVKTGAKIKLGAAGTTDGGVKYSGKLTLATTDELKFNAYANSGGKYMFKQTVKNYTDLQAAAYNVSGGQKLAAESIVAVKINSAWKSASAGTMKNFDGKIELSSTNICKIAGKAHDTGTELQLVRPTADGKKIVGSEVTITADGSYLSAGRLVRTGTSSLTTSAALSLTAFTSAGANRVMIGAVLPDEDDEHEDNGALDVDKFIIHIAEEDGEDAAATDDNDNGIDDEFDDAGDTVVKDAAVFVGPFMEVKMQSSTTKLVVGAVCLSGKSASDTAFYMDNASDIVTASGAKIFIDGGFGSLTMQTSDYAGAVSAIGNAGNAANIGADGLVVIGAADIAGLKPYLAVDLAGALSSVETLAGFSYSGSGLGVALDVEFGKSTTSSTTDTDDKLAVAGWDLGASYAMGDISLAMAADSSGDVGMKGVASLAGMNVSITGYNKAKADHKKFGFYYDAGVSMNLNGASVGVSFDQDQNVSASFGYDIGAVNVYASYAGADKGGKVGAKLSF